jgi:hypothetical protein
MQLDYHRKTTEKQLPENRISEREETGVLSGRDFSFLARCEDSVWQATTRTSNTARK